MTPCQKALTKTFICAVALLASSTLDAAGNHLLVPIAGSVPGARDTFFRTDVTIRNASDTLQNVQVTFLPAGFDNASRPPYVILMLHPFSSHTFDAGELLAATGIGAILIKGVTSDAGDNGPPDPAAKLTAVYRIYTNQPGHEGTTSQSSDAIDLTESRSFAGTATGLRHDASFRTNVGVVNLHPREARTFRVRAQGPTTAFMMMDVTVPAMSMTQRSLPAGNLGHTTIRVELADRSDDDPSYWTAYASSIDNATGDSWLQRIVPDDRPRAATLIVPVAGIILGAFDTFFRTDLTITNHLDVAQRAVIAFYESGTFFYGDPASETTVVLQPRSTITYENVVGSFLRMGYSLGTIVINGSYPPPFDANASLSAVYRIWTPQGKSGGTVSQSSTAIDVRSLPDPAETRIILGLRQDADFRCNIGIYSDSYYHRLFRVRARSSAETLTMIVMTTGFALTQVPLSSGHPGYLTVEIEPLDAAPGEVWAAYGTSIDNRSGDSWLQNALPH